MSAEHTQTALQAVNTALERLSTADHPGARSHLIAAQTQLIAVSALLAPKV